MIETSGLINFLDVAHFFILEALGIVFLIICFLEKVSMLKFYKMIVKFDL